MTKKTLVIILNHNLPMISDNLADIVKVGEGDFDVAVMDNGSEEHRIAKNTKYRLKENVYFGGGLDAAFELLIDREDEYDSLLFMNNDLFVHGYNFVQSLREALFGHDDYWIVSPCVMTPVNKNERDECAWRQMHNWGSAEIRKVKWVDFQCPMFHSEFVHRVQTFPNGLRPGYGYDIYSGLECDVVNKNVGVCDWIPVYHTNKQTLRRGASDISEEDYGQLALQRMFSFFGKSELSDELNEYREWANTYRYGL